MWICVSVAQKLQFIFVTLAAITCDHDISVQKGHQGPPSRWGNRRDLGNFQGSREYKTIPQGETMLDLRKMPGVCLWLVILLFQIFSGQARCQPFDEPLLLRRVALGATAVFFGPRANIPVLCNCTHLHIQYVPASGCGRRCRPGRRGRQCASWCTHGRHRVWCITVGCHVLLRPRRGNAHHHKLSLSQHRAVRAFTGASSVPTASAVPCIPAHDVVHASPSAAAESFGSLPTQWSRTSLPTRRADAIHEWPSDASSSTGQRSAAQRSARHNGRAAVRWEPSYRWSSSFLGARERECRAEG